MTADGVLLDFFSEDENLERTDQRYRKEKKKGSIYLSIYLSDDINPKEAEEVCGTYKQHR